MLLYRFKLGLHCNTDLGRCNVTNILGQCEHRSSVIAVAVLMFGGFVGKVWQC